MGMTVRHAVTLVVLSLLIPGVSATSAPDTTGVDAPVVPAVEQPVLPQVPDQETDFYQVVYRLLESADGFTRASCSEISVMPSDSEADVNPQVGTQALGVELNGGAGPAAMNVYLMTAPDDCVAWAQDALGSTPMELEAIVNEILFALPLP